MTLSAPMPDAGSSGVACCCVEAVREKATADAKASRTVKRFMPPLRDLENTAMPRPKPIREGAAGKSREAVTLAAE
jgi:hypothetical protein